MEKMMEKYVAELIKVLKAEEPELLAKIYKTYLVDPIAATEFVEVCLANALNDKPRTIDTGCEDCDGLSDLLDEPSYCGECVADKAEEGAKSLLERVTAGDDDAVEDWGVRAKAGEIMRIM